MEGRLLGWVEEGVWVLTKASNPAGNGRRKELDVGGGAAALAARRWPIPVGVEHGRACCCAVEVEDEVGEAPAERTGGGARLGMAGTPAALLGSRLREEETTPWMT